MIMKHDVLRGVWPWSPRPGEGGRRRSLPFPSGRGFSRRGFSGVLIGVSAVVWALGWSPSGLALDIETGQLIDEEANVETVAFYANLMKLCDSPIIAFGQQGATHQGVGWSNDAEHDRSDVHSVIYDLNDSVGYHPALDGYNVNWALETTTLDGGGDPKGTAPTSLSTRSVSTATAPNGCRRRFAPPTPGGR